MHSFFQCIGTVAAHSKPVSYVVHVETAVNDELVLMVRFLGCGEVTIKMIYVNTCKLKLEVC